ncbi:MAG: hypothetical protein OES47_04555 [Acidobacteriota bacterium]|nr:hypothetical protein [Acidobacteriota bacterium]
MIERVHDVAAMHMGPEYVLVNLSVDFSSEATADEVESLARQLDAELKAALPEVKRVFFEAEMRRVGVDPPSSG